MTNDEKNSLPMNAEMAKAHQEGRKTQFREVMEPQPLWEESPAQCDQDDSVWCGRYICKREAGGLNEEPVTDVDVVDVKCPHKIGEKLWVQEPIGINYCEVEVGGPNFEDRHKVIANVFYLADWFPVIHTSDEEIHQKEMPQKYSRSTIEITGIKVEKEDRGWVWVYEYRNGEV